MSLGDIFPKGSAIGLRRATDRTEVEQRLSELTLEHKLTHRDQGRKHRETQYGGRHEFYLDTVTFHDHGGVMAIETDAAMVDSARDPVGYRRGAVLDAILKALRHDRSAYVVTWIDAAGVESLPSEPVWIVGSLFVPGAFNRIEWRCSAPARGWRVYKCGAAEAKFGLVAGLKASDASACFWDDANIAPATQYQPPTRGRPGPKIISARQLFSP